MFALMTDTVVQSAYEDLAALRQAGVLTVLATSRYYSELEKIPLAHIPFDGYFTLNGKLCPDENHVPFTSSPISPADTRMLADAFAEKRLPLILLEQDRMYANFMNDYLVEAHAAIHMGLLELSEYTGAAV